jgi:hypothetical protein
LYDDAGDGLDHLKGRYARTAIRQRRRGSTSTLTIGPLRGSFAGKPSRRSWDVRLVGVREPKRVSVGGRSTRRWRYDAQTRTVSLNTGLRSTRITTSVVVTPRSG